MGRVEIEEVVLQPLPSGALQGVSGATVYVYQRGTTTQVPVYTTSTGSTVISQPLTTRYGRIEPPTVPGGECWIDPGAYDLAVSSLGASFTQHFEAVSFSGGSAGVPTNTADDFQPYRIILLSNGTVKAIPSSTPVPGPPTGLATTKVSLASVHLQWVGPSPSIGGAQYAIWRNNVQIALSGSLTYRDTAITQGSTYTYQVQTVDPYGQRSPKTSSVSAFIDPAGNVAPTLTVKTWPLTLPTIGKALVRVNGADVDAQSLAYALSVDVGTLTPTQDPSEWLYSS